jgi:hypothetical protein
VGEVVLKGLHADRRDIGVDWTAHAKRPLGKFTQGGMMLRPQWTSGLVK